MNLNCKTTDMGAEYMGRTSMTISGKTCQAWTATSPHDPREMAKNSSNFPDASIADASNYCRNPDEDPGPWCYTMDSNVRFEYCDISICDDGEWWWHLRVIMLIALSTDIKYAWL